MGVFDQGLYSPKVKQLLDNAIGSGTTGVACVNTDRNFIGIESDEVRWQRIALDR